MKNKLKVLREFQDKYPTAHVGGSIGLMLRGVNVLRDLSHSDLDITVDKLVIKDFQDVVNSSGNSGNDFDLVLKRFYEGGCVKLDIRICPEPSFDVVNFEGVDYNVSKYRDIIYWKTKYAKKGVLKHKNDLEAILTGVRPLENKDEELPF